jgi:transcriptional regulator
MLIRAHDAAFDDEEWRSFLGAHDFGQLVASGRDRATAVIVPTHFVFDGSSAILLHLARANPVWEALEENPTAVMSVAGAYTYIPTHVNGGPSEPSGYGVPTSYYGAVQAAGTCEIVDEEHELSSILMTQLGHFEPGGSHEDVRPGDNPYGRQLRAIRGIRMSVDEVRSKFKFGNNKTVEHRLRIAAWLEGQPDEPAQEARGELLRRMGGKF